MSQPPTPSKLKRVFKKKNELSPKRSHSSSLSRNSSIDNQNIISSNKMVVTQQRKNHSSFVFLLTGLDNSQRHLVNHICTNSSTQIVPEYTDEGKSILKITYTSYSLYNICYKNRRWFLFS